MDYILAPSILSADFKVLAKHFFWNAGIKIYPQCNRPGYGCASYGAGTNSLRGGF